MTPPPPPSGPIGFAEARAIVARIGADTRLPIEQVAVEMAAGRVLARPLLAEVALPGFDNSAMDGFAVRAADLDAHQPTTLHLIGEQFAGIDRGLALTPGGAIRITTGAPLPTGADTVVIKENARVTGTTVVLNPGTVHGANVRHRGEDLAAGAQALAAGIVLNPAQASLAAALGCAQLPVHRRPHVAVFSTGDELRQPGATLVPGSLYDSNTPLLHNLLADEGIAVAAGAHLPDAPQALRAALTEAAGACDLILSCGGVSAGEKDFLPALVAELGEVYFWKVRIKPGMPILFGRIGNALILALPGNPVAVLATFRTLVVALLDALQGRASLRPRWFARLHAPLHKDHARFEFQRGVLRCESDGTLWVDADAATGSHRLAAAANANALICVPEGAQRFERGAVLEVLPLTRSG